MTALTGRVVVLEPGGVLSIHEIVLPAPSPHQVVVETFAAGIQHAQITQIQAPPDAPVILGREASGRVIAVGSAVIRVSPGDLVLVGATPAVPEDREPEIAAISLDDGSTTESVPVCTWATDLLVDEQFVSVLPPTADREAAAILADTMRRAADATASVGPGDRVVVFGAGPLGISAIATAKLAGADVVVAVAATDERLARAAEIGATAVVDARSHDLDHAISELTRGGADLVVDCIDELDLAVRPGRGPLREGGSALLLSTVPDDAPPAHSDAGISRLLEWFGAGDLDPAAIVTERFTIEQVNEATVRVEDGEVVGAALLVFEPLQ